MSKLPTKKEIIAESKYIYNQMNNSSDSETIRQAQTAQMMFISGAWFSRKFKKTKVKDSKKEFGIDLE